MIRIADRIQDAKSKVVYGLIRSHGTVSKQDLIQWSGLAPSTMVRMLDDLLVEGLIKESGYGELVNQREAEGLSYTRLIRSTLTYLDWKSRDRSQS